MRLLYLSTLKDTIFGNIISYPYIEEEQITHWPKDKVCYLIEWMGEVGRHDSVSRLEICNSLFFRGRILH